MPALKGPARGVHQVPANGEQNQSAVESQDAGGAAGHRKSVRHDDPQEGPLVAAVVVVVGRRCGRGGL